MRWAEVRDETFDAVISRDAVLRPNRVCLVDGALRMTYQEVDDAVSLLVAHLIRLRVGRGDAICIQLPNWSEFLLAFLAASRVGAVACLVPVTHRANEIRRAISLVRPKAVVIPRSFRGHDFPGMYGSLRPQTDSLRLLVVDREARPNAGPLERFDPSILRQRSPEGDSASYRVARDDRAVIFFTSGTSGEPKAALHSHHTLIYSIELLVAPMELTEKDVTLVVSPLSAPGGLLASVFTTWLEGGTAILMEHYEAAKALDLITTEKVTMLVASPAHLHPILAAPDPATHDLSSLRLVRLSAAFAPPELVRSIHERMRCRVAVTFGMTEVGPLTISTPGDPLEVVCETVGKLLPGMETAIFDEAGKRLGTGQIGQIAARGPSSMLGYLNEDGSANSVANSDGWLFTGDLGFIDEAGYLHFAGRSKDIINRGGIKISAMEVEKLLLEHPKVESVAVVAMPDERLGERSCAYVVPRPGQAVTLEELVGFLIDRGIATYKLPERLELLDALPLTRYLGRSQRNPASRHSREDSSREDRA